MEKADDFLAAGVPAAEKQFWRDVEAAFSAVLSADDSARAATLETYCGASTALRQEVETLLAAHKRAVGFIAPTPTDVPTQQTATGDREELGVGSRVGAFRLDALIAEGGMGAVYRAERVEGDFSQRVAVKVIAACLYGADTLRRFAVERQILASFQHPHIVSLLDGGVTPDGHPYIVMEYVEGVAITEYCRRHALGLEDRLRLFRQLAQAVSFAHRHLVVHRDLKPANVLVTGDGTVKVLDFGVAKLLDPEGLATGATCTLFGPVTPDYASPEQLSGAPVTTARDVYALGVMMYELLAGRKPYLTAGKSMDELMSLVLGQEPAPPSTVAGPELPYAPRRLRGDLDAVVLRAMAKDPERRYASAEELAQELGRCLERRPVKARPPSMAYLAGKTVARHKAGFAIGSVLLGLGAAVVAAVLWQARAATRERERAVRRFADVRQLAGAMIFTLHDQIAPLAGSTPARRTLVAEGLRLLELLQQDVPVDPAVRVELARTYMRIGDVLGNGADGSLGDADGARGAYRKAQELLRPLATPSVASADVARAWVDAQLGLSSVGHEDERVSAARMALAAAQAWQAQTRDDARALEQLAKAHFRMALLAGPPESLPHWLEAERLFDSLLAASPHDAKTQRSVALIQKHLGGYYEQSGDFGAALAHHRKAHELDRARLQLTPDDRRVQLDVAIDVGNIANGHLMTGDYTRAIAAAQASLEIRRRLSAADPEDAPARARLAYMHTQLARSYRAAGRLEPARLQVDQALALYQSLDTAADHAKALIALAEIETARGRRAIACAAFGRARHVVREASAGGERSAADVKARLESEVAACR